MICVFRKYSINTPRFLNVESFSSAISIISYAHLSSQNVKRDGTFIVAQRYLLSMSYLFAWRLNLSWTWLVPCLDAAAQSFILLKMEVYPPYIAIICIRTLVFIIYNNSPWLNHFIMCKSIQN